MTEKKVMKFSEAQKQLLTAIRYYLMSIVVQGCWFCLFVLLCFGVCLFGFSFVMICESSGRASHRELLRALKRHTRVWSQETQKTRNSFWIRWALHYKCFLHLKKEMFLILFYPQIFREFLTNVLLPTSTKEPDVPACRKFVTEFAIQVLTNKMSKK